jgi:hypothetical protein
MAPSESSVAVSADHNRDSDSARSSDTEVGSKVNDASPNS